MGGLAEARRDKIAWPGEKAAPLVDETAVTDVQFELRGAHIPLDHGLVLFNELARLLPWLAEEKLAAIHPVHGADNGIGQLILNRRTKLVVRIPRERLEQLLGLSGQRIIISGNPLDIGAGKPKPLPSHTPLYAHIVTTGSADERDFTSDIMRELDDLEIETRFLCGKRQTVTTAQGMESGYSLMLHGLPIEHSIRIQQIGLGGNRKLGCGIFIPHKSINAV